MENVDEDFKSGDETILWSKFPTAAAFFSAVNKAHRPCPLHHIDLSVSLLSASDIQKLATIGTTRPDFVVTKLRLAYNALDDDAAPGLLDLLNSCRDSLQYLDLSFNNIGDTAIGFIAAGWLHCSELEAVYLTRNDLTDSGVKCLIEVCTHNRSIKVCNVDDNPRITPAMANRLKAVLAGDLETKSQTVGAIEKIATSITDRSSGVEVASTPLRKKIKTLRENGTLQTSAFSGEFGDDLVSELRLDDDEEPLQSAAESKATGSETKENASARATATKGDKSRAGRPSLKTAASSIAAAVGQYSDRETDRDKLVLDLFHVLTLKSYLRSKAKSRRAQKERRKSGLRGRFLAAARAFLTSTAMVADMHFRRKLLGKLGLQATRRGGGPNCVLSRPAHRTFKVLFVAAALFCLFWVPYSCAIIVGELAWFGSNPSAETEQMLAWVIPVDLGMMLLFWFDICFGFCTPFNDRDGEVVRDQPRIVGRYLRHFFGLDFVVCFPWPLLAYAVVGAESLHVRWLYIAPVLLRPSKLIFSLNGVELASRPVVSAIVKMCLNRRDHRAHARVMSRCSYMKHFVYIIFLLLVAAHLLACVWIYIAYYITHGPSYGPQNNNWMIEGGIINSKDYAIYTSAIYWAMTTLTTVGFGDIGPTSTGERLVATVALIVGIAINALFIGRMSVLMLEFTEASTRHRRQSQLVEKVCGQYNFPSHLRDRIEELTAMTFSGRFATTSLDVDSFLKKLSPSLRMETLHHMHRKIFDNVPVLRFNSLSFQRSVAVRLQSSLYLERDYVAVYGDPCDCVNFLLSGTVGVVNSEGSITHSLETGSFFGEQGILATWDHILRVHGESHDLQRSFSKDDQKRTRRLRVPAGFDLCQEKYTFSVRTLSPFCEAYFLRYKDVLELFQLFPAFANSLRVAGKLRTATASANARISKAAHEAKVRLVQESAQLAEAVTSERGQPQSAGPRTRDDTVANLSAIAHSKSEGKKVRVHPMPPSRSSGQLLNRSASRRLDPPVSHSLAPSTRVGDDSESRTKEAMDDKAAVAAKALDESIANLQRPQTPPPGHEYWTSVVANPKFIRKYQSLMERSRSIQGALYNPKPRDLSSIALPWSLQRIVRHIAQNIHEHWAQLKLAEGWSWGFEFVEKTKRHPLLVPHQSVPAEVKRHHLNLVVHVLKLLITKHALVIDDANVDATKLQWEFGRPPTKPRENRSVDEGITEISSSQRSISTLHHHLQNAIAVSEEGWAEDEARTVDISNLAQQIYGEQLAKMHALQRFASSINTGPPPALPTSRHNCVVLLICLFPHMSAQR